MNLNYYTLHFDLSYEEADKRIERVFKLDKLKHDENNEVIDAENSLEIEKVELLNKRFPSYANYILKPITELKENEYRNLSLIIAELLDSKLGNTLCYLEDKDATPKNVKIDGLVNKEEKLTKKELKDIYLSAKMYAYKGTDELEANRDNIENIRDVTIDIARAYIQFYDENHQTK